MLVIVICKETLYYSYLIGQILAAVPGKLGCCRFSVVRSMFAAANI